MGLETTVPPANDWSFYRITGRQPNEILVWPTVISPLRAPGALDEVVLGVDEDANVVWAVEQRVDGRAVTEPGPDAGEPADGGDADDTGDVMATGPTRYRYVPSAEVPYRWHPYLPVIDGAGPLRFSQGRLADLATRPVTIRPGPTSRLLRDLAATDDDPAHRLARHAVPRDGIHVERRYVLGRRTDGLPVLWIQRSTRPLRSPPTSGIRFDVLEPVIETR